MLKAIGGWKGTAVSQDASDIASLKTFEPGSYIELSDVVGGFRKLCLVVEPGNLYFDQSSAGASPFPIYAALDPVDVGGPLAWGLELMQDGGDAYSQYSGLQGHLMDVCPDPLMRARALKWAASTRTFAADLALAAAQNETDLITAARAKLDALVAASKGA